MTGRRGLLIACGEPVVAEAVESVARTGFGLLPVERVLLPGGAWWLAEAAEATSGRLKRLVSGRLGAVEAVSAMLAGPEIEAVVLVGHTECGWYRERLPGVGPGEMVKRVGTALFTGREELRRLAKRPIPVRGVMLVHGADGWSPRDVF